MSRRDDLTLMYFPTVDLSTGRLVDLRMTPPRVRHFRANRASREEVMWLRDTLDRESRRFGVQVDFGEDRRHLELGLTSAR